MQCQKRFLIREAHSAISNWGVRYAIILGFPKDSYSFVHKQVKFQTIPIFLCLFFVNTIYMNIHTKY